MSAERGWTIEPQPVSDLAAGWVAQHHDQGHHPHPAPTSENPERWDCDCGYIWRILTPEQIRQKFAHLKPELREGEQARRPAAKVEQGLRTAVPSPPPLASPISM